MWFLDDERYGSTSKQRLREAFDAGALIVGDVVYAELAPAFGDREALDAALREINVTLAALDASIAWDAGRRWLSYRRAGRIGAHALAAADRFLTRDRGFCGTYFPELKAA